MVSLHINPDEDIAAGERGRERLIAEALRSVERVGLRNADLVLPSTSRSCRSWRGSRDRYAVAYNVLNADSLRRKRITHSTAPLG